VWGKKNAHEPVPSFLHRDLHLYEVFNWAPWPIVLGILMVLLWRMGARSGAAQWRAGSVPMGEGPRPR
jgi:hypothetical protein